LTGAVAGYLLELQQCIERRLEKWVGHTNSGDKLEQPYREMSDLTVHRLLLRYLPFLSTTLDAEGNNDHLIANDGLSKPLNESATTLESSPLSANRAMALFASSSGTILRSV
jgi:hypothetical protein